MIQLSPNMRVFLHLDPIDFRNGIDGLSGICRNRLKQDPMSGALFLFTNRRRTSLKILVYDGQGFWLCQKRLSEGRFKFWPRNGSSFTAPQIQILLYNGDPLGGRMAPAWKVLPGTI